MSDVAIHVEGLSKRYRIGGAQEPYGTLRDTLMSAAKAPLRVLSRGNSRSGRQEFWALQDVSFEVKQGEVLGVIGHNGAGKSTLLRILSRITKPTGGRAVIHGRVGSLLEVGTGFHPELTGRENIYLNGAILGMQKTEIERKFDEIVEFAEIGQFLDTPVKRYSSGMYMRLAFSIAAHLEPEILIVDEVLAVGDAAFQKKCLGKMGDVAKEGRTVLFVSHNMDAIQRLCSHCCLLKRGKLADYGDTRSVITNYLAHNSVVASPGDWIDVSSADRSGTGDVRFMAVQYSSLDEKTGFRPYPGGPLEFLLAIVSNAPRSIGSLAVVISSQSGIKLVNADTMSIGQVFSLREGNNIVKLRIDRLYLMPGVYTVGLWLADPQDLIISGNCFDQIQCACEIDVIDTQHNKLGIRPGSDGVVTCSYQVVGVI
jgi:lipopolysaccharide transport system ATP-binding protein